MPNNFADWYRSASIAPPQEFLEQRWNGVEEAAKSITPSGIIDLLRLFSITQRPGFKAPEFMDSAFRKFDTAFPTGNLEELRVLAGAILRQVVDSRVESAVTTALGLVTSSFGRRTNLPTADHVDAAEKFLAEQADDIRKVNSQQKVGSVSMTKERFDELLPPILFAQNQTPNLREPLFNALNDHANKSAQEFSNLYSVLWRTIQMQREELNSLWWLQARFSRQMKKPFRDFSSGEAVLVFAAEVSSLTELIPGPSAVVGILVAALDVVADKKTEITIIDAVKSTDRGWRARRAEEHKTAGLEELCPILLAVTKSLETEGETDWLPVYRRYCDVGIDSSTKSIDLAYQFYRELLFSRAIRELKS